MTDAIETTTEKSPKAKKVFAPLTRTWALGSCNSRDLVALLNKLSAEGSEIFSVNANVNVGGMFEILSYTDK